MHRNIHSYLSLKYSLCIDDFLPDFLSAFYSERSPEKLFQPEPGCSDPTFVGSTADVIAIASNVLNISLKNLITADHSIGIGLVAPFGDTQKGQVNVKKLPSFINIEAGDYRIRISRIVFKQVKGWVKQNNRVRSNDYETGGLIWGFWDAAVKVIWIFDSSGPPSDSKHGKAQFTCGIKGTIEEHKLRMKRTYGVSGFIGYWHTHPNIPSCQSNIDMENMANLVSCFGQNQKRSLMLIFGKTAEFSTAGIYLYESHAISSSTNLISIGVAQFPTEISIL